MRVMEGAKGANGVELLRDREDADRSLSDPAIRTLTPDIRDRQSALEAVQREIVTCALCVEAGFIPRSLPIFHGHVGQRLMIVGQAPGPSAGERPLPYTGATGRTLQGWLERAGFPPEALHRDFYLTSLTKCFPGPGDKQWRERGSPAFRHGDRILCQTPGSRDRAGAPGDRRLAGAAGGGAARSDGAQTTPGRSRGEHPTDRACRPPLSSTAPTPPLRRLALVERSGASGSVGGCVGGLGVGRREAGGGSVMTGSVS